MGLVHWYLNQQTIQDQALVFLLGVLLISRGSLTDLQQI